MNTQKMNDVAKEVITVLNCCDKNIIDKIPKNIMKYLEEKGNKSEYKVYIDSDKKLTEQNLLEESKDLIALIYYSYIADEEEKKNLVKKWSINEKKYEELIRNEYDYNNMFKKQKAKTIIENNTNLPIEVQKKTIIDKIMEFIRKIFNKQKNNIN